MDLSQWKLWTYFVTRRFVGKSDLKHELFVADARRIAYNRRCSTLKYLKTCSPALPNPTKGVDWLLTDDRDGESLEGTTVSHDLGFTFCYVSTHEAKPEVAITAGTFLILIYMKIDLFRNVSDFRNLFRDGQSPHCILRVFITSCRVNSTNVLYQCYISLHGQV